MQTTLTSTVKNASILAIKLLKTERNDCTDSELQIDQKHKNKNSIFMFTSISTLPE